VTARRTRPFRLVFLLVFLGLGFYLFVLLPTTGRHHGPGAMKLWNEMRVKNTSAAIEQFHIAFDRWPTNLSELITNSMEVRFIDHELRDRWNREFRYSAPKAGTNGQVGSFGRDGRQGGSGLDEDFFVQLAASR
jgi:hypothetical protein